MVCYPRRIENLNLPSHFKVCVARLKASLRSSSEVTLTRWSQAIIDMLNSGVVQRNPQESRYCVHYLPQRLTVREGKVFVVVDASDRLKSGPSLNDLLYAGPSLTGNTVSILLNFRLREIGITAVIEKAFSLVGLDEADRNLVQFHRVEDIYFSPEDIKLIVYRFTRILFGVVSYPFLFNMMLQEHLANSDNPVYQLARK